MSKGKWENQDIDKNKVIEKLILEASKQSISKGEILKYIIENKEKVLRVPVSVFALGLSPLQAIVKYLVENKAYKYSEISRLLNRNQRTIWNTYNSANKNYSGLLDIKESKYSVSLDVFKNRRFSFLEALCVYLRKEYSLNYREIARILGKDERTVWTVVSRAEKKKQGVSEKEGRNNKGGEGDKS